jgi:hypothetical protein
MATILREYTEGDYLITEYTRDGETVAFTVKALISEDLGGTVIELPKNPIQVLQEKVDDLTATADQRYNALDITKTDIETVRVAKIAQLKEQCTNSIYAGFASLSLNTDFGFNDKDQDNFGQQYLLVVAGDNAGAPIQWKTKSGVVTMDEAAFRVLVKESKEHKMTNQVKYWTLEAKVLSATTVDDIDKVVWS